MRKTISLILAATLALSMISAVTLGIGAAVPASAITFDSEAEIDYYTAQAGKNCSENAIQDSGTAQGKAFKYSVIPCGWDGGVKASALRIAQNNSDGTVSAFNVTPGKSYSISFKYKNDKELTSWGAYTKLLYVDSASDMGDFLHTANVGPDYWNPKSDIESIAGVYGEQRVAVTDGWVDYSCEFKVPADITNTELALVFVVDNTVTDASLWVDDILVTDLSASLEPTMKFDSAQEKSYYTNPAGQNCSAEGIQDSGTAQGKAFKYSVIPCGWDGGVKASALRIAQNNSDGTVSAFNVTPGKSYSISFKYKNDKELTSWGVYAMLLYVDSASNMGDFLHTANVGPDNWNPKSGIQTIAGALGEQRVPVTDGWVDYSSEFKVPTDITNTELALVFVADNTVTDASLWVDDITVTEFTQPGVVNMNFDTEKQRKYQSSVSAFVDGNPDTDFVEVEEGNYAAYIKSLPGSNYSLIWYSSLKLSETKQGGSESIFNAVPGTRYTISFKAKASQELENNILSYYLCNINPSSGQWFSIIADTRHQELANTHSLAELKEGWVEYSYTFNIPNDIGENTALALVPISDGWKTEAGILIDDLTLTVAERGEVNIAFETDAQRDFHSSVSALVDGKPDTDFVTEEDGNHVAYIKELPGGNYSEKEYGNLKITETMSGGEDALLSVTPGSYCNISFRVKATKDLNSKVTAFYLCFIDPSSGKYFSKLSETKYQSLENTAILEDMKKDWVEYNYNFMVPNDIGNNTAVALVPVIGSEWGKTESGIYIDDVKLVERNDYITIKLETNGGSDLNPVKGLPGELIPVFNAPERAGYAFTGWYTDKDCKNPYVSTPLPKEDFTLYAGWVSINDKYESFATGFEKGEFKKQAYSNDGTAAPVSDATMTDSAVWNNNDPAEAYDGKGYITFDDGAKATGKTSERYMAISLYNPDGTPFCVTEGKRYKVSLAFRHSGSTVNENTYFLFLITNQSPGIGVNYGNSTVLYETGAMGADKHDTQTWGEFSTYAVAGKTGPVKLAMYGTTADQTLDVDNVKIELMSESECVKVEYFQQNQDKDPDSRYSCGVRYGAPGDLLIAGQSNHIDGYAFNGWRTEDGKLYTSNRFPNSDLTLYASWRVADNADDAAPNPKEEFLLDFEDTDRAKAFYEDSANNYHPENGVFLMVNDPDNAHSGNNYFKFYQCGHWTDEYLRRFKLYDPDAVGNQVYLEPNSVYKVSFWLNIESVGAGNLYLCTFPDRNSMTEYEVQNENYITDTNSFENFGKWVLYENTVVTGDDEDGDGIAATLGFALYGGYLTARLDDISIIKLKEVTVSFESNGGSDVNDITQLSYDYAIAPADPEREGYTFTGWYTDEKLTQPFNFKTELITKDIKLYAGWKVAEKDTSGSQNATNEKEPIYNTVIDYEKAEQTVGVEVPDKELDEQLTFADTDKVGKINKQNTSTDTSEGSSNPIWVIIPIAGGVVLVAAAAVVTVMVVKKRKRRN